MNEELDALAVDATERAVSVSNKASFLAVTSGIIVAAVTSRVWSAAALLGISSLALALLALFFSALALRPGLRAGLNARRMVDRYQDSALTALQIEEAIVRDKATVLDSREEELRKRAVWVSRGFFLLAVSTLALIGTFTYEVMRG